MWGTFVSNKKLNVFDCIKGLLKYYDSLRRSMRLLICSKYLPCPYANSGRCHNWEKVTFNYTVGPESHEEFAVEMLQNPASKLLLLCFLNGQNHFYNFQVFSSFAFPAESPWRRPFPMLPTPPPPHLANSDKPMHLFQLWKKQQPTMAFLKYSYSFVGK